MASKPKPLRSTGNPTKKPAVVLPNKEASDDMNPADSPSKKSPQYMKDVGGSGLMLWDNNMLLRTMRTLRPPTLNDGETVDQHKQELAGCAGIALEAFKPKDAIEAMIAGQAVALHFAAMECARRAMMPEQPAEIASRLRKDTANLARAMVDMTEALERRRGKGPQVIRVEKMMIAEGGQAVVGNVTTSPQLAPHSAVPALEHGGAPMEVVEARQALAVDTGGREGA